MSFTPFQTPPPSFFSINGIYAHRFDPSVVSTFDAISTLVSTTTSGLLPDPFNNRFLNPPGKFMSYQQIQDYRRQIALFQKVYSYNLCEYETQTVQKPAKPYKFITMTEQADFLQGTGIINKLYNTVPGFTLQEIFILNFPPFTASFPPPPP
jgi:hypothetical protein